MLVYKNRNTFLQNLHPLSGVILIIMYIMALMVMDNPFYLIAVTLSVLLLAAVDGCYGEIRGYGVMMLPLMAFMIILNAVFNHNGRTVLLSLPALPVIGSIRITLEAMVYGTVQAIRLLGIILVFALGNHILHPDRTFSFFSKYLGNSALLMNMTLRLFPTILKSLNNIIEVEKLRGNRILGKGLKKNIQSQSNIVNILFLSCLEDASDMAESMHSRGYGTGKRSVYFKERFKTMDFTLALIYILMLVGYIYINFRGMDRMSFYPALSNPVKDVRAAGLIFLSLFYLPAAVNWGWKLWRR